MKSFTCDWTNTTRYRAEQRLRDVDNCSPLPALLDQEEEEEEDKG